MLPITVREDQEGPDTEGGVFAFVYLAWLAYMGEVTGDRVMIPRAVASTPCGGRVGFLTKAKHHADNYCAQLDWLLLSLSFSLASPFHNLFTFAMSRLSWEKESV